LLKFPISIILVLKENTVVTLVNHGDTGFRREVKFRFEVRGMERRVEAERFGFGLDGCLSELWKLISKLVVFVLHVVDSLGVVHVDEVLHGLSSPSRPQTFPPLLALLAQAGFILQNP
jgi:hypothetical protein